jgi:hypothetical protein
MLTTELNACHAAERLMAPITSRAGRPRAPASAHLTQSPAQTRLTLPHIRHRTGHLLALVPRALAIALAFPSRATTQTLVRHSPCARAKVVSVGLMECRGEAAAGPAAVARGYFLGAHTIVRALFLFTLVRLLQSVSPLSQRPDLLQSRLPTPHPSLPHLDRHTPLAGGAGFGHTLPCSPKRRCSRGSGALYSPYTLSPSFKFSLHRDRGMSTSFVARRCSEF